MKLEAVVIFFSMIVFLVGLMLLGAIASTVWHHFGM
jgi:hypothetical protein